MNNESKKLLLLSTVFMLAAACNQTSLTISSVSSYDYSHQMQIGDQTLLVEIAATPAAQEQGLSGRSSIMDDQGMLFDFSPQDKTGTGLSPQFWMKDMKLNLDFIWIYKNKIVGITSNVPAPISNNQNLPTYSSASPIDQVLEVNAGWAKKNNIKIGDEVALSHP